MASVDCRLINVGANLLKLEDGVIFLELNSVLNKRMKTCSGYLYGKERRW